VDDLSTWYLRRSRDRFKGDDAKDKEAALEVTRFVLVTLMKLTAPFVPFISEHLYQKVKGTGMPESVHLCSWPTLKKGDDKIGEEMSSARKLVETGLALRAKAGIKVRQPLAAFYYDKSAGEIHEELEGIIADELNVKSVSAAAETTLDTHITEELKEEGAVREAMRAIQDMRKKLGLAPGDSIHLHIAAEDPIKNIFAKYEKELKKAVVAKEITLAAASSDASAESVDVGYGTVQISISK
jgi:isoleucyl-tRNA synthetase